MGTGGLKGQTCNLLLLLLYPLLSLYLEKAVRGILDTEGAGGEI